MKAVGAVSLLSAAAAAGLLTAARQVGAAKQVSLHFREPLVGAEKVEQTQRQVIPVRRVGAG